MLNGSPSSLIHNQSDRISVGQHPIVGFHHWSINVIFFHIHLSDSTCSATSFEGISKKKWPSVIAKVMTKVVFHVLHAHLLTLFNVGGSSDEFWNLPTMHLPSRSFEEAEAPPTIFMLSSGICICAFLEASVVHLLLFTPLWRINSTALFGLSWFPVNFLVPVWTWVFCVHCFPSLLCLWSPE